MGVNSLANIKSAKKRIKVIEKKTARNRMLKSALRTSLKKFNDAVDSNDAAKAQELYPLTVKRVDMACSKGLIHKNKANRTKSQLAGKLNTLKAE